MWLGDISRATLARSARQVFARVLGVSRLSDEFDSIRPYRDDEVRGVLTRLVREPELLAAVAQFRMPWLARLAPRLVQAALSRGLAARLRNINTVRDFQQFLESYFVKMVRDTTAGFTFSGAQALHKGTGYLFVSNHRDIAMDSGFMNYALWVSGMETSRIAIGDNLLKRAYLTDMMRLNKSFVIRRNVVGVKEMTQAYQLTSRYLHHSIAEGVPVWIAQREGRAKDGVDRTEPAIIKMFLMSQRKTGRTFGELISALNIVPVCISYENDPCDAMKARELWIKARDGAYAKPETEDIQSIVQGIMGYKGRVHLAFGNAIGSEFADPDAVAAEIDRQIINDYRIWPTNLWAAEQSGIDVPGPLRARVAETNRAGVAETNSDALARLQRNVANAPAEQRPFLLMQYANPVRAQIALINCATATQ